MFRATKGNALCYFAEIDKHLHFDDDEILDPKSVILSVKLEKLINKY